MSYLLIGLAGTTLSARERTWLRREEVGGVILFARNFATPAQLGELLADVRAVDPAAIACVDQEGGRVQRIRAPATVLPPLGRIGAAFDEDPARGLHLAFVHARLMARELLALGLDLSLAPVLDVDAGSRVIGDRAFHRQPAVVERLGVAYLEGLHAAGMAACGKHFPGHGTVTEDTHEAVAVDRRALEALAAADLLPFAAAVRAGLDAMMMGHVCYPALDDRPAGYSRAWIREFLRGEIGFEGVVISDDLGMAAATVAGGLVERLAEALAAGSDFVLVCAPEDVAACCAGADRWPAPGEDRRDALRPRFERAETRSGPEWARFQAAPERHHWQAELAPLAGRP